MRKKIAIFGSTGSVGTQVLQCLRFLEDIYDVVGLVCNKPQKLFEEQQREWRPRYSLCVSSDENPVKKMCDFVNNDDVEYVVNAISGTAGVELTKAAIESGKTVFLANKESMVMRGVEFMKLANERGAKIVPLDSEACGLWQLLRCENLVGGECNCRIISGQSVIPFLCYRKINELKSVTITASGGPFFGFSREQLAVVSREQALNHPTWKMGKKISIDSATLVNKAFEVIECARFFNISVSKINVLVDRKSYVHAGVEFLNGEKKWVVYPPDMRSAITYALTVMADGVSVEQYAPQLPIIIDDMANVDFKYVDNGVFPAISHSIELAPRGDVACAEFCAKNELAVNNFLNGAIPFINLLT